MAGSLGTLGQLGITSTPTVASGWLGSGSTGGSTGDVQTLQPTVNGGTLNNGGYSLGSAPAAAPVDQWAGTPWGSKAAYDAAVGGYGDAKGAAYGSIAQAGDTAAGKYNSSILDYLTTYGQGVKAIDRAATQNELARKEGQIGVTDMVGRGIANGGAILSNANASNSTAAGEIAKAYAQYGRKELSKVGNQYELGNENIAGQRDDLNTGLTTFQRHMGESKIDTANAIVSDATTKLAQLNALAQNASLPDRIEIEQEKARIRNEVLGKLSAYDSVLASGVESNKGRTTEQNRAEAARLLTAGVAPEDSFNFSTNAPTQFAGTGPYPSDLPLFTGKRPNDKTGV